MTPKQTVSWLKRAVSKDKSRPDLTCVNVEANRISATDGYQLHIYKRRYTDDIVEALKGNVTIHDPSLFGKYPNIDVIGIDKPAVYEYYIDADKPRNALPTGEIVKLTFWENNRPLMIQTATECAMVMFHGEPKEEWYYPFIKNKTMTALGDFLPFNIE